MWCMLSKRVLMFSMCLPYSDGFFSSTSSRSRYCTTRDRFNFFNSCTRSSIPCLNGWHVYILLFAVTYRIVLRINLLDAQFLQRRKAVVYLDSLHLDWPTHPHATHMHITCHFWSNTVYSSVGGNGGSSACNWNSGTGGLLMDCSVKTPLFFACFSNSRCSCVYRL